MERGKTASRSNPEKQKDSQQDHLHPTRCTVTSGSDRCSGRSRCSHSPLLRRRNPRGGERLVFCSVRVTSYPRHRAPARGVRRGGAGRGAGCAGSHTFLYFRRGPTWRPIPLYKYNGSRRYDYHEHNDRTNNKGKGKDLIGSQADYRTPEKKILQKALDMYLCLIVPPGAMQCSVV